MTSIELTAPAKVNIYLKILNKRKDSYHNILTLFERISLFDRIKISRTKDGIIVRSDRPITADPKKNIVYKAARLVLDEYAPGQGIRIDIVKRIPIAAGLGGGSSDAASALIGIRSLLGLNISNKKLMQFGEKIGADVPFFLFGKPCALGKSKGERLAEVKLKQKVWHLLINPGFGVSTRGAYEAFDERKKESSKDLTTGSRNVKINLRLDDPLDFVSLESMLYNDLQKIVAAKKKAIGSAIKRLASVLGKKAILSGSGPSLFCLYRTRKEALEARRVLLGSLTAGQRRSWLIFVVRTA